MQPRKKSTDAASSHGHTRVTCPVIEVNAISIRADGLSTREYNVENVTSSLIWSFWTEHPRVSSLQTDIWLVEVEKSETKAIDAARYCPADPMFEHKPALRRFNRQRTKTAPV